MLEETKEQLTHLEERLELLRSVFDLDGKQKRVDELNKVTSTA